MKKRILVLGSEGVIGSDFCEYAISQGHEITRVDKKMGHDLSYFRHIALHEICKNLSFDKYDVVLFLAFNIGGSKYLSSSQHQFSFIDENVGIMTNTFNLLDEFKIPFLFASSQMSEMNDSVYGTLKRLGEFYTKSIPTGYYCRFWNVYGKEKVDEKSHVITDFIDMAKKGCIKVKTNGSEARQFLHVRDCSKALLDWCLNYQDYSIKNFDITSFVWSRIHEVADIVKSLIPCQIELGNKMDTVQKYSRVMPNRYILNHWKPEISLYDGIKSLI